MKMLERTLIYLTASLLFAACGRGGSDGDFSDAVPSEGTVTINAPDGDNEGALTAAATEGETSEYYKTTRKMTREINGGVRNLVNLLQDIVENPPTTEEDDRQIWGPGGDALSPVEYRFWARRTDEDGVYSYALDYREKGSEDLEENYTALITGNSDVRSGIKDGLGDMTVYFDNWVAIEGEGACGSGTLGVDYDTTSEPQFLAVEFDNFRGDCDDGEASHRSLEAAAYYYSRFEDGSGNFQFSALGDIDHDTLLAGVNETFAIRSRWNALGEGRSDVIIYGGDILANHGIEDVTANECWDEYFKLTYADMDPPAIDPSHNDVGEEANCVFDAAEYATDIDDSTS